MFTGIVEEQGMIEKIINKKNLAVLTLKADKVINGTKQGDSIAIDGVCLTVTAKQGRNLTFDIMKETLSATTLKNVHPGQKVNLERALTMNDRLGGHFVTGHIDGTGVIKKKIFKENYAEYHVMLNKSLARYIVPKGSVCIDGVSLTVGEVKGPRFSVYLIPHTLEVTTFGTKKISDKVNIETDILAKYVLGGQDEPLPAKSLKKG